MGTDLFFIDMDFYIMYNKKLEVYRMSKFQSAESNHENMSNNFFKYSLYALLVELGTILLAFLCWMCSFSGGEIPYYTSLYVIPYLPILFLFINKIGWRIIALILPLFNMLFFVKILEWILNAM